MKRHARPENSARASNNHEASTSSICMKSKLQKKYKGKGKLKYGLSGSDDHLTSDDGEITDDSNSDYDGAANLEQPLKKI